MSMDGMSKRARKRALRRQDRRQNERQVQRIITEQIEEAAIEAVEQRVEHSRRALVLMGYDPDTGASLSPDKFEARVARLGALTKEETELKHSTIFNFEYAAMVDAADTTVDELAYA